MTEGGVWTLVGRPEKELRAKEIVREVVDASPAGVTTATLGCAVARIYTRIGCCWLLPETRTAKSGCATAPQETQ